MTTQQKQSGAGSGAGSGSGSGSGSGLAAGVAAWASHVASKADELGVRRLLVPCAVAGSILVARAILRKKMIGGPYTETADLTGKVVIITGASSGVGEETAFLLANMNAHVILASRNEAKTKAAIERIRRRTTRGKLDFLPLDLASLDSVKDFQAEFDALHLPLHYLILNAGVIYAPQGATKDGFETHFGTNHLGHFLLTHLLLNKLIVSKGRVVSVSSQLYVTGRINFDDLFFEKTPYSRSQAYANSKLANILFIQELQRKLKGTGADAFSVSPGLGLRHHTGLGRVLLNITLFFIGRDVHLAAQSSVMAAVAPSLTGHGGSHIYNCRETQLLKKATDPTVASKLWEVSRKLVGLENEALARQPSQKVLRRT